MQNGSRLFAYSTWVVMISLAIILFTNQFLVFVTDPGWIGLVALLAYGFIYLNFSYLAVKRYIRKLLHESNTPYILALLIFLPAAVWAGFFSEQIEGARGIFIAVIAFSCGLGAYYGRRAGLRQQEEMVKELKKRQAETGA